MKANELMLADWVHIAHAGNAQVVMIDQYHVQTTYAEYLIDERKLEPINLTSTILDKNADWSICNYWQIRQEVPFIWIRFYDDLNAGSTGPLWRVIIDDSTGDHLFRHIKHVHQLQHALRLMGLTDLADNFKIE